MKRIFTAFTNQNPERSRDRVLTDSELATIWKALPDSDYGDILKLLILTGQRREEIARLQWSEINFAHDVIALPGARKESPANLSRLPPPFAASWKRAETIAGLLCLASGRGLSVDGHAVRLGLMLPRKSLRGSYTISGDPLPRAWLTSGSCRTSSRPS